MRFWKAIILLITTITLTSCFNTADELWIEADGSGRFQTTTDLSNIYPFLLMGLEKEINKEPEEGEEGEENSFDNAGKKMVEDLFMSDNIDTIFNLEDLLLTALNEEGKSIDDFWDTIEAEISKEDLPDAQKESLLSMIDAVTRMAFHLQSNKEDQLLKTTMMQSFSSIAELSSFSRDIVEILPYMSKDERAEKISADQMASVDQLFSSFAQIDLSGNTLRVRRAGMDLSALGDEVAQVAPMLGMFLGNNPYRLVIHLPGKVKKASPGVTIIDKKTVAIEMSMADLFDPEKSIDFEITFKGLRK